VLRLVTPPILGDGTLYEEFIGKGNFMQNSIIKRLAKNLRKSYRINKSWRTTSSQCKVLTEDMRVNPGLAKRIARDKYQPSDEVIERLERHGAIEQKQKKAHEYKDLFDMPAPVLLWKYQHREVMQ